MSRGISKWFKGLLPGNDLKNTEEFIKITGFPPLEGYFQEEGNRDISGNKEHKKDSQVMGDLAFLRILCLVYLLSKS